MKKAIFFVCTVFLAFSSGVDGQDLLNSQVPASILAHFEKDFPKVSDVDWEKEGDLYKVDFELKRRIDMEVWYDSDGTIVRQEEEWKKSELPSAVDKSIATEFPDYKIGDVYKITENTKVHYEVELDSRTRSDLEVWVDSDGKVLESIPD